MVLTSAMRKIGRRNFLKAAGGVSALAALGTTAIVRGPARGGPIRAALIGYGKQGRILCSSVDPDLMNIVAICDIKAPTKAETTQLEDVKWHREWRHLIHDERIEAILIATPLGTHAEIAIGCLEAGKHVFCETAMALDLDGCTGMIQASKRGRRLLHIGYQNYYEPLYWAAYRNIVKQGVLGDIYSVEAACHSSDSGYVSKELDAVSFDPQPWGYSSLEQLANWRLYRRYSNGLTSEFGGALISLMNWYLDSVPVAVQATGGTYSYKDGRDVDDHVYATLEYPNGRTATLSLIQSNGFEQSYTQFMGKNGTLIIGNDEALLFTEEGSVRATIKSAKVNASHPVIDTSASRSEEASSHSALAQGTNTAPADSTETFRREIAGFCGGIRSGASPRCSPEHARDVTKTCLAINEAIGVATDRTPHA